MYKAFKYRLYPTEKQKELIKKHISSSRFVYNLALETKTTAYASQKINITNFELVKQLPELKKECEWLREVNSQSLQQTIINLDTAYKRFFKGISDFPRYKKRASRGSFSVPQNVIVDFNDSKLIVPKFKEGIDIKLHRKIKDSYLIRSCNISMTPTGKYFASVLVETNIDFPKKKKIDENTCVGIDLGIKDFLTTSDGKKYNNPKDCFFSF